MAPFLIITIITMAALAVTASAESLPWDLLFPSLYPTETTSDPWMCETRDIYTRVFVPMPTPAGALGSTFWSFQDEIFTTCWATQKSRHVSCEDVPDSTWCDLPSLFQTQGKTVKLTEYSSYGRAASTWLAENMEFMVEQATECPQYYWHAVWINPPRRRETFPPHLQWLNQTLLQAQCYAEAHAYTTAGTVTSATTTAGPGVNGLLPPPTSTVDLVSKAGAGRQKGMRFNGWMWIPLAGILVHL
ncbi:hypothetical protein QBC38DRAFT_483272 [Podospora fimiseda]|uniref:DUF7735 domain-containing protein n=1 Tax=Podospora fimiseda TaxID=252190 RepID=A0AAN7GRM8_9PEZI|nr:hypothetical protein QBC38DRAFT_483272 [Podospora fimiseda]